MQMLRMELFKAISQLHCFLWSQGENSDDWKGAKAERAARAFEKFTPRLQAP